MLYEFDKISNEYLMHKSQLLIRKKLTDLPNNLQSKNTICFAKDLLKQIPTRALIKIFLKKAHHDQKMNIKNI